MSLLRNTAIYPSIARISSRDQRRRSLSKSSASLSDPTPPPSSPPLPTSTRMFLLYNSPVLRLPSAASSCSARRTLIVAWGVRRCHAPPAAISSSESDADDADAAGDDDDKTYWSYHFLSRGTECMCPKPGHDCPSGVTSARGGGAMHAMQVIFGEHLHFQREQKQRRYGIYYGNYL